MRQSTRRASNGHPYLFILFDKSHCKSSFIDSTYRSTIESIITLQLRIECSRRDQVFSTFNNIYFLPQDCMSSLSINIFDDGGVRHFKTPLQYVENLILEKVWSGASGQTFALPAKKKESEQMEVASASTYASILVKGLKWVPVTVHSFRLIPS